MPELRRLLLLCVLGLVLLAYGLVWQARIEPGIVIVVREELVVFPQTHSVAPRRSQERLSSLNPLSLYPWPLER